VEVPGFESGSGGSRNSLILRQEHEFLKFALQTRQARGGKKLHEAARKRAGIGQEFLQQALGRFGSQQLAQRCHSVHA